MSIQTQINRILANIAAAYTAAQSKDATMPDVQNSEHLSDCILSIKQRLDLNFTLPGNNTVTYNAIYGGGAYKDRTLLCDASGSFVFSICDIYLQYGSVLLSIDSKTNCTINVYGNNNTLWSNSSYSISSSSTEPVKMNGDPDNPFDSFISCISDSNTTPCIKGDYEISNMILAMSCIYTQKVEPINSGITLVDKGGVIPGTLEIILDPSDGSSLRVNLGNCTPGISKVTITTADGTNVPYAIINGVNTSMTDYTLPENGQIVITGIGLAE